MGSKLAVIALKGVAKSFRKQEVLKDISFEVKRGEIFGIVGSSGSGKSTLLKIITGNMLPDKGEVLFEPKDLAGYSLLEPSAHLQSIYKNLNALKRTVGYSAQNPSFYEKLTCLENIDFFGSLYKLPSEILKINSKILLKLVGLDSWKKKLAGDLSGGMKKRLDLACSLVHDPKILVLDEPTADLDFLLREQMWSLIRKIRQKGTTVIMSSHFIDEIEGLCDKIIILNNSNVEFIGSPEELKKRKNASLVLKIKTSERKYDVLHDAINKKYGVDNVSYIFKEGNNYLQITFNKVKDAENEVPKILDIVKKTKQKILEFTYSKEGISEMFKELNERVVDVSVSKVIPKKKKFFGLFSRSKKLSNSASDTNPSVEEKDVGSSDDSKDELPSNADVKSSNDKTPLSQNTTPEKKNQKYKMKKRK